jgi:hypothetical protein
VSGGWVAGWLAGWLADIEDGARAGHTRMLCGLSRSSESSRRRGSGQRLSCSAHALGRRQRRRQ